MRFAGILAGLEKIKREFGLPVVYPIHPRSRNRLDKFNLSLDGIKLIDPIDFLRFIHLEANAKVVLTDSGGVQEETCILGVPCVTLRDNTERPETLEVGSNVLAGTKPEKMLECVKRMINSNNNWKNPFGDGKAGEKIVGILQKFSGS
jgi:UDP-N-acetylglucosamine 2-epimerase (non-hydrolysing)